jgi:O-methyltransferase
MATTDRRGLDKRIVGNLGGWRLGMLFVMVSTKNSQIFTPKAIESFFKSTHLDEGDRFVVIDNDACLPELDGVEYHRNWEPRSFAENANIAIGFALSMDTDLVLMNNDIIFSKNWLDNIRGNNEDILIPSCNQNIVYAHGGLQLKAMMDLEEFGGKTELLDEIARIHFSNTDIPAYSSDILMPFYCVLLPRKILKIVGFFDESFGRGGGEDVDYRIRAMQCGFQTLYANRSYLLHFMGKATWRSGEARTETLAHDNRYREAFISKWGLPLAKMFLVGEDKRAVAEEYGVVPYLMQHEYARIVERLSVDNWKPGPQPASKNETHQLSTKPPGLVPLVEALDSTDVSERRFVMIGSTDLLTSILKVRNKYLNILEASLTGTLHEDPPIDHWSGGVYDPTKRLLGRDWPGLAQTMIGTARMQNLRKLCESAIMNDIPGDFIETGVWRGGACIYMRGILDAHGDAHRRVFVADSFKGLPPPRPETYAADAGDTHHVHGQLAISRQDVAENFRRYGLLDERVVFLEGWFKDTLPVAPIDRLSVLRLDGDMYESTIQALDALYHKVSRGGFVIVDDYFLKPCAQAVDEYRARYGITSPLLPIDGWSVWWLVDHEPMQGR